MNELVKILLKVLPCAGISLSCLVFKLRIQLKSIIVGWQIERLDFHVQDYFLHQDAL
jgi:hypothetical protein